MTDNEPVHGTTVTNDSKEAADKVSEHTSKLADAIQNGNAGEAVKEAAKVVGYVAQTMGHISAGN